MKNPYRSLPAKNFWRKSVAKIHMSDVDPVTDFDYKIDKEMRVATAGSCFAQHIARHMKRSGFNYYVAENGHPILDELTRKECGYGLFSARYGNIYTSRQLLQLFERAFNLIDLDDEVWSHTDGSFRDPYRPTIQPNGFVTIEEALADRNQHLLKVREMFTQLDVFVFTLGLTECWRNKKTGIVYPICPGVDGGEFDGELYEFYNQSVLDVIEDLRTFEQHLLNVNPEARIILTVSPVPLMATADVVNHVLTATTYSKSVLRVAAETVSKESQQINYFPSYEIITGSYNQGTYFAEDLRSVVEDGVNHVMRLFFKHITDTPITSLEGEVTPNIIERKIKKNMIDVECDEELLDRD